MMIWVVNCVVGYLNVCRVITGVYFVLKCEIMHTLPLKTVHFMLFH